jgi:hypothetical protein
MASVTTEESLRKPPMRQVILYLSQEGLPARFPPPQGIAADAPAVQVHLGPDQAVGPPRIDRETPAQQLHFSAGRRAPQEHQPAAWRCLQVQPPLARERPPRRGRLDAGRRSLPCSQHVPARLTLQPRQRLVVEAGPHLGLPAAVEALDGRLEPGLTGRDKHWHDLQAEAGSGHAADRVRAGVRAVEEGVVVELRIGGQANVLPVLRQGLHDGFGRNGTFPRPRGDQAAMQGHAVENLDLDAAPDDQPFHDVEAVEFRAPAGHVRQIPPPRWRWSPDTVAVVERSPPLQDAADGSRGRRVRDALGQQRAVDRLGAELTEVAGVPELLADAQDEVLQLAFRPVDGRGQAAGAVAPIHPIQALASGATDPALHGAEGHVELQGDLPRRGTTADCLNDLPAALFGLGFLVTAVSWCRVSESLPDGDATPEC